MLKKKREHKVQAGHFLPMILCILCSLMLSTMVIASPLVAVALCKPFYLSQFEKNDLYSIISPDNASALASYVITSLKDSTLISQHSMSAYFTEEEKSHVLDVSILVSQARAILAGFAIALAAALAACWIFLERKSAAAIIGLIFVISAVLCVSVLIAFSAMAIFDFSSGFGLFHTLLFPQGSYAFQQESMLITIFPENFFRSAALISAASSLAVSVLLAVTGVSLRRYATKSFFKSGCV